MTQELWDLRVSILEERYEDALTIVDELDWMSRKGVLRNIRSFLIRLILHLIKNQVERRLTNSWAASIKGSILEIQDLNLQDNKNSHYIAVDRSVSTGGAAPTPPRRGSTPAPRTKTCGDCYIKQDEWDDMLDFAFDAAITPASAEVFGGLHTPKQLEALVDKSEVISTAKAFLDLTYSNSQKFLPAAIDDKLVNLPGGEDWELGQQN
jgi:hypothetical protein